MGMFGGGIGNIGGWFGSPNPHGAVARPAPAFTGGSGPNTTGTNTQASSSPAGGLFGLMGGPNTGAATGGAPQGQSGPGNFMGLGGAPQPMQQPPSAAPIGNPAPQMHPQGGGIAQAISQLHPHAIQALRGLPPGVLQSLHGAGLIHPGLMQHIHGQQN